MCASDDNLRELVEIIGWIDFNRDDTRFLLSQFYEDLLARLGKENQFAGEFHTPRPVVRFMVEALDPQIGETVYDPACGLAGFLVQAYLHMKPKANQPSDIETLCRNTFYGKEKKGLAALLGSMNLILHGVTSPNITRGNTLEEPTSVAPAMRYDVILANPPFGGKGDRHLQQKFPVPVSATELLFLQHMIMKLSSAERARVGVVLPDGSLFRGGSFAEVRRILVEYYHVFAVISLPPGVFAPYSDVKTSLVFFRRAERSEQRNSQTRRETLYCTLPLPDGMKKFTAKRPIHDDDFAGIRSLWKQWQLWIDGHSSDRPVPLFADLRSHARRDVGGMLAWAETQDDLRSRKYNLQIRAPDVDQGSDVPDPEVLIADLRSCVGELTACVQRLHNLARYGKADGSIPHELPVD